MVGIKWDTGDIINGRRVKGRTFWGPADDAVFTTTGQITGAVLSAWPGYFDAITDPLAARMVVWHRPTSPSGTDGQYCDVTSVSIGTKPFDLRSRRD
jgi:hypothetical protein